MSDLRDELYEHIPRKDYNDIKGIAYKVWVKSFAYIALDDLIQEGVVAYLSEKKKYDKTKNDYFMGYAYKRVLGSMLDYVAKNSVDKYKTVRKNKGSPNKKTYIVPAPENVEDFHITEEGVDIVFEELYKDEVREFFREYLESLTELEKYVLYSYFVEGTSMYKISRKISLSRLKVKRILLYCISYLRRKLDLSTDISDVSLRTITRGYEGEAEFKRV